MPLDRPKKRTKRLLPVVGAVAAAVGIVFLWRYELSVQRENETPRIPGVERSSDGGNRGRHLPSGGALSEPMKVLEVIDGDTIVVDINGNGKADGDWETVQLLGVDAEEIRQPPLPEALEAKTFAERLLKGASVRLAAGRKETDVYGRTLAFVHVVGEDRPRMLNEELIRLGYARFYRKYTEDLPAGMKTLLAAAQNDAKKNRRGPLWKDGEKAEAPVVHLPADGSPSDAMPVLGVTDGDTIVVDMNGNGRRDGRWEEVRLLGVAADELSGPRKESGLAAMEFVVGLLKGAPVRLARGSRERDSYGRTLAYVYVRHDGRLPLFLNEAIIREGYARFYKRYSDELAPDKRGLFEAAEAEARGADRGPLWSR